MTRSTWADRWHRYGMLLRAPLNFARAQTYRKALFLGMGRGESFVRAGRLGIAELGIGGEIALPLVTGSGAATLSLVLPSIALDRLQDGEGFRMRQVLGAAAAADVGVRLIAVERPVTGDERRVRTWLTAEGLVPASAQAKLDIVDATAAVVPVNPGDVFVCGEAEQALLRQRLGESGMQNPVHVLTNSGDPLEALRPMLESLAPSPSPWPERSRLGLGYRVAKPLAEDFIPGDTCLFAHFDPDGRLDPHVLRYLAALKACGFDTVLISACDLDAEACVAAEPLTAAVLSRQNKGLDFAGWALALELYPQLMGSRSLMIANDSVYAPVGPLQPMLERMAAAPFDVWGAVESADEERHFQSWFVCFGRAALQSSAFADFWAGVLPLDDKSAVIAEYEVPMWRAFEAAGLRVGAAFTLAQHGHTGSNPTMDDWRAVLDSGAPFLKVQLLRDNPLGVSLDGWAGALSERGYPAWLVLDHLYRVKGADAAVFRRG